MRRDRWPEVNQVLGHEAGNLMNAVVIKEPSEDGPRSEWREGNEVIDIYNEFSRALEEGDELAAEAALEDLRAYDSPATPEYPRQNVQSVLSLIDAARAYEDILEESYGREDWLDEDSVKLGEVLEPFEWNEGVETCYDPEIEVNGNEALKLVSNTIVKNWKEHGIGKDGGRMWLDYQESDDNVMIQIYDDGPGIEENPGALFEVDEENKRSYFGLSFARALTEEFNGTLEYFEPGTGGMGYEWELEKI